MKKNYSIQEIANLTLAGATIFITVLRIFGVLDWDFFDSRIPSITLILLGLMIISSTLERRNTLSRLENKIDNINDLVSSDNLGKLNNLTQDINPLLQLIFKDFIQSIYHFFEEAVQNERIEFYDLGRFKTSYIRTLQYKQKDKNIFWATSLPYKRYFWAKNEDSSPLLKAMEEFIKAGGEFNRVFFCEEGDLNSPETISILNDQLTLGIKVYIIQIDKVPRRLQKYFVVDNNEELAWEVLIDTKQRINLSAFTTSKKEIAHYKSIFEELMNLDELKSYSTTIL